MKLINVEGMRERDRVLDGSPPHKTQVPEVSVDCDTLVTGTHREAETLNSNHSE